MLYFCLHFLIYFFIVETSKATLKGIIKYYYNYTTNDSGKDYQSQGRSRTHTFRKDFFRVHVCKPETLFFFFQIQMLCIMFDKLDVLLWCTVCSRSDFANQRRVLSAHGHVCVLVIQR